MKKLMTLIICIGAISLSNMSIHAETTVSVGYGWSIDGRSIVPFAMQ